MFEEIKNEIKDSMENFDDNKTVKKIMKIIKKNKLLTFIVAGYIAYEILGD